MNWTSFVWGIIGGSFASTLFGVVFTILLEHGFQIRAEKLAEERHLLRKQQEASIAVTEILKEWTRSTYTGEFSNKDRWNLQTIYWKSILWLDKDLLDVLLPSLAKAPGAAKTNELIVEARKVLLGLPETDIKAEQLNNWLPENE
jgi:hypothetical protein